MARVFNSFDFSWKDNRLLCDGKQTGCKIVPDKIWPGMFRVEYPLGNLCDMANLTRAKDAALTMAMRHINRMAQETEAEGAPVR